MPSDFSAYSTADLLRIAYDEESQANDLAYNALWAVFGRWRKGIDLDPLIELLQSEKSGERQRGAWYLDEADPPSERLADVAIKLADDPVDYCRSRFVTYATNSGLYGDAIADRLAACLIDRDLYVRAETIFWAVVASDAKFAHFSDAVLAGAGTNPYEFSDPQNTAFWRESTRKRAVRGIDIARRLRVGEAVENIRKSTQWEDSLTFDVLAFRDHAIARALERRAAKTGAVRFMR